MQDFEGLGLSVLSPRKSTVVDPSEQFVRLDTDPAGATPRELEMAHLRAISEADLLYICNPTGAIGSSSALEIGWAYAIGRPIWACRTPKDPTLRAMICGVASAKDILKQVTQYGEQLSIHPRMSLRELQDYVSRVVGERGFDYEDAKDILLLLLEEVGELARAVRKRIGLKRGSPERENDVASELSDVVLYVLDLANNLGVDLGTSLVEKEQVNRNRRWE
jgi:NTP pyrophosphatase (non-canonical NTP hydrolase)/nucleoside 2-deoxyribosyltransferase